MDEGNVDMDYYKLYPWVLIIMGLFLINYYSMVLFNTFSGLILSLGIILFVYGVVLLKGD